MFPGWVQPLLVIGLFLVIELVASNVVEPRLYGHSIGVSEVALLVAAAFWAFLWGPIGLVLSSPLTVCLVVLGKYVPQLEFLDVLLGDEPPLDADVTFYQRLLARDQDEATQLVLAQAKASSPEQVYDDFLVPALNYVKRDRERDDLTEADEQFVLRGDAGDRGRPGRAAGDCGRRRRARRRKSGSRPRRLAKSASWGVRATTRRTGWHWRCCGSCSTRPSGKWKSCRWRCSPPSWWRWPGRRSRRSSASARCRRAVWPTPATCASGCGPGCPRPESWWGVGDSRATWNRIRNSCARRAPIRSRRRCWRRAPICTTWLPVLMPEEAKTAREQRILGQAAGHGLRNEREAEAAESPIGKRLMAVRSRRLASFSFVEKGHHYDVSCSAARCCRAGFGLCSSALRPRPRRRGRSLRKGRRSGSICRKDAHLTFDGESTASTGAHRVFLSPPLVLGKEYSYTLRAEQMRGGEARFRSKTIKIRAGEETQVDLRSGYATVATAVGDEEAAENRADKPDGAPPGKPVHFDLERFLKDYDKNKDGRLSRDELPPEVRAVFDRSTSTRMGKSAATS